MLNEEKIQAMTDLAVFEKHQGRKIFPVNQYFKSDYVGGQLFRSFFGYTFSFALILLMWILYKLDVLIKGADIDQLIGWIRNWGLAYVTGLGDIFLLHGRSIPDGMILHPEARPCMWPGLNIWTVNLERTGEKRTEEEPLYDSSFAVERAPERNL